MIDRSLLRQLPPDLDAAVQNAILTIANSGVVEMQLSQAFESVVSGSVSEDPTELASKILQYRRENHGLIALKELADQLKKESSRA
jgi:hypothetical protein